MCWSGARSTTRVAVMGHGPATGLLATPQFMAPYGCTSIFQWHAMAWQRYMHRYGATREHLATFVTNSRRNANLNPNAYFYTTPHDS